MKKKITLISIISIFVLSGCASVGNKIDRAGAERIKVGNSKQDVLSAIGKPDGVGRDAAKGQEIWTYIHMTQTMKPESFIPLAGAFVGGVDTATDTVTVFFDQDGKVSNVNTSFATENATANTISGDRKAEPKPSEKPAKQTK
jgi:outer membrane protein assembly factor BamE (lipoprotein component of BamABCDE complex)